VFQVVRCVLRNPFNSARAAGRIPSALAAQARFSFRDFGAQVSRDGYRVLDRPAGKLFRELGAGSVDPAGGHAGSAKAGGPGFLESSYGFRPGRPAHQAVAQPQQYITGSYCWCVDFDLGFF
jgi:hypothetical protein